MPARCFSMLVNKMMAFLISSTARAVGCDARIEVWNLQGPDALDQALDLVQLVRVVCAEPGNAQRDALCQAAPALDAGVKVVADDHAQAVEVATVDQLATLIASRCDDPVSQFAEPGVVEYPAVAGNGVRIHLSSSGRTSRRHEQLKQHRRRRPARSARARRERRPQDIAQVLRS